MPSKFNNDILAAAIEGFEVQKRRIDGQIAEIRQLMGGAASVSALAAEVETEASPAASGGTRRKMSAAGRKRIAEAQRKRWADVRKQAGEAPKSAKPAKKAKRKLSEAGRQRIIEATKKRWAAVRAAAAKAAK
jgi:hypothetical protein